MEEHAVREMNTHLCDLGIKSRKWVCPHFKEVAIQHKRESAQP